ncbi:MAG: hypothetical protein FVQ84_11480 [Planctomycetes bacterium]|nr:hypothetical protein [Planctomycetota bacterium]
MRCKVQCSTKKHSKCSDGGSVPQRFPDKGLLACDRQRNLSLVELKKNADQDDPNVHFYVVATIKYQDQRFLQYGTGPNFQGDLITLCTCKHLMRSSMDVCEWRGKWIAGFTSITEHQRKNFLVYMMKVSEAFESHYDLWFSESISCEAKRAKAAHLNRFGDIYEPKYRGTPRFVAKGFKKPCKNHNHVDGWPTDIKYEKGYSRRPAALLVGDQRKSFLWNHPKIWYPHQLPRQCKKLKFNEFLDRLRE